MDKNTEKMMINPPFEKSDKNLSVILAAGHGKRIKSTTSKMLHKIWGEPTVSCVVNAAASGLASPNQIVVVGIKAEEVAAGVGKTPNRIFAMQSEQHGTGHAVQVALEQIPGGGYSGDIYIFPGDMGLLQAEDIQAFQRAFSSSDSDMMVLTGIYRGEAQGNYYGRIIRVPVSDVHGDSAGEDANKVIEIKEHKDILKLGDNQSYQVSYQGKTYAFSKQALLDIREFNSGVFAFKAEKLFKYINALNTDNAQGELYITDLISIFNQSGLAVNAEAALNDNSTLGFNTKSVLQEMNEIALGRVYDRLKDIILIEDPKDFFLSDDMVSQIIALDKNEAPIDMSLGKGARIGAGAKVSKGLQMGRAAQINGNVTVGKNCCIGDEVVVKGAEKKPSILGDNVIVDGKSYLTGCIVEAGMIVEHCVLVNKRIKRRVNSDGVAKPIRFVMENPDGTDVIEELK